MLRPGQIIAIAFALLTTTLASAQTTTPTNSLPNPYRSIESWGELPDGRKMGLNQRGRD